MEIRYQNSQKYATKPIKEKKMKGKLVNEHLESCSKYCDNFPTIRIITTSVNCLNTHEKTDFSECIKSSTSCIF